MEGSVTQGHSWEHLRMAVRGSVVVSLRTGAYGVCTLTWEAARRQRYQSQGSLCFRVRHACRERPMTIVRRARAATGYPSTATPCNSIAAPHGPIIAPALGPQTCYKRQQVAKSASNLVTSSTRANCQVPTQWAVEHQGRSRSIDATATTQMYGKHQPLLVVPHASMLLMLLKRK